MGESQIFESPQLSIAMRRCVVLLLPLAFCRPWGRWFEPMGLPSKWVYLLEVANLVDSMCRKEARPIDGKSGLGPGSPKC